MNRLSRATIATVACTFACSILMAGAAFAHHVFAAVYDGEKPITFTGTVVTNATWAYPHAEMYIDAVGTDREGKAKAGATTRWLVEMDSPRTLLKGGIKRANLYKGTVLVIEGYQTKKPDCRPNDGVDTCLVTARTLVFPNGCRVFVGTSGSGAPRDGAEPAPVADDDAPGCTPG